MYLPYPNLNNRSLPLQQQLIERMIEIDPIMVGASEGVIEQRRKYLSSLKDFALLQSFEVMVSGITYDAVESLAKMNDMASYRAGEEEGYKRGYKELYDRGYGYGYTDGISER